MAPKTEAYSLEDVIKAGGYGQPGRPNRIPIRLFSAMESVIYWIPFALFIWFTWDHFRPDYFDGGKWFDRKVVIVALGWMPFGMISNGIIRLINRFVLRTDWRRPSLVKKNIFGHARRAGAPKGYRPPEEHA